MTCPLLLLVLWLTALEQMVEEVEPCRQELVSFGVDMGVYLESYFKQVTVKPLRLLENIGFCVQSTFCTL